MEMLQTEVSDTQKDTQDDNGIKAKSAQCPIFAHSYAFWTTLNIWGTICRILFYKSS